MEEQETEGDPRVARRARWTGAKGARKTTAAIVELVVLIALGRVLALLDSRMGRPKAEAPGRHVRTSHARTSHARTSHARRVRWFRTDGPLTRTLAVVVLVVLVVLAGVLAALGTGAPKSKRPARHAVAFHVGRDPAGSDTTGLIDGVPVDSGTFPTGACVSFAPTDGDNGHTVFIDPGHGGIDPGGEGETETGTAIYEDTENLSVGIETSNLLRAKGFRVVLSRVTSTTVALLSSADMTGAVLSPTGAVQDVAARDACADDAHATVLLGIYMDAGTSPTNAGCLTAWDPDRSFAAKSFRLASLVQSDVLAAMNAHGWQIPNDGVDTDTTLGGQPLTTIAMSYNHLVLLGPGVPGWFTTPSEMPGALIEPLFLTDPFEGSIANSTVGHEAIAHGMAEAIEQYFAS